MSNPDTPTKTISDFEARLEQADKTVAQFEADDNTTLNRIKGYLRIYPTLIPAAVLILSYLAFGLVAFAMDHGNFFRGTVLSTILQQMTVVGFIALAQTIVILTAGIELSVGEILILSALIMANLGVNTPVPGFVLHILPSAIADNIGLGPEGQYPAWFAIAAGVSVGALMGLFNGILITKIRLPPFIVTLGTLSIFRALKLAYSHSESVRNVDIEAKASELLFFGGGFKIGTGTVTYGMICLVVLAAIVWFALNRTAWGRHVHAIGDDPDAAMLSGIKVDRTLISVYTAAGAICGFAAWVAIGRVGSVSPIAFGDINLASITAVVIGGTSLFGGRGSVVGAVLGAIIVQLFTTGLSVAARVDDYWQTFAAGCLVIIAVALDQYLRRASK
jgi:fructose transport system permease protein